MESWNTKKNKQPFADKKPNSSRRRTMPSSVASSLKKKPSAFNREIIARKVENVDNDPLKNASFYVEEDDIKGEYTEEVSLQPEGGARKNVRRVHDHIESLLDFDPDRVIISTMSSKYIEKISVVNVTKTSEDPGCAGGVNDIRMGVTDGGNCCVKCLQSNCPGHPGRIDLPFPVINRLFFGAIIAVMGSVCHSCGKLLHSKKHIEYLKPEIKRMSGWNYLNEYSKASKPIPCLNDKCKKKREQTKDQYSNPPIVLKTSKDKNYFTRTDTKIIGPNSIYSTLDAISDKDAKTLGFNKHTHPRDLMIRTLVVIPPIARPSVSAHGKSKQDQLTHKYSQIVGLVNFINASSYEDSDIGKFQEHINLYEAISELIGGSKKRRVEFEEFIDIIQRIKSKKGLFRKAIQGKRTNYSARAVLSPSIDLEFGEIGVPEGIARYFHAPVTVTTTNYEIVKKLFLAGKIVTYTPCDGVGQKLPVLAGDEIKIKVGDDVERMAMDGDMVIFNRQPTIHHGSLLGYTVRVMQTGSTIKIHPSSTTTHNADFDGDAAMLLYPRDPDSVKEVRELMHAIKNIIDDKQNRPLAGVIMDGVSSAYLMTKPDEIVHPFLFNSVLKRMKTKVDIGELQERAGKYGLHPFSGRTLFSALLPPDFIYNHAGITVYDGILLRGRITNVHIDTTARSMVQDIWKIYGDQRAADFLTDATWVLIAWLDSYGFSVGPEDIDFGNNKDVKSMKFSFLEDINSQIRDLGDIPKTLFEREKYEMKVVAIINRVNAFGESIAKKYMNEEAKSVFGRQNAIGIMAEKIGSGAKAKIQNVTQIGGSAGQQIYAGDRPKPVLPGSGMFLPREDEDDEEVEERGSWGRFIPTMPIRPTNREAPVQERGYCVNSFSDGMTPSETFSQAWGTRGDLINTNMMTAPVGEAQRRLTRALENITVHNDGSVRALTGPIYQFDWGGDGLESMHMLISNTSLHGRVPVFCDVGVIVERINSKHGLIKTEYLKYIRENREMIGSSEEENSLEYLYQKEKKRGNVPSIPDRVYGEQADEIEEPIKRNKIKYGTPVKISSTPSKLENTPKKSSKIQTPKKSSKIQPLQDEDSFISEFLIPKKSVSKTFEMVSGDKISTFDTELVTEEEHVKMLEYRARQKQDFLKKKEEMMQNSIKMDVVNFENFSNSEEEEEEEEERREDDERGEEDDERGGEEDDEGEGEDIDYKYQLE
jgi:DNA-directed RNA polymerase beta' subunit